MEGTVAGAVVPTVGAVGFVGAELSGIVAPVVCPVVDWVAGKFWEHSRKTGSAPEPK